MTEEEKERYAAGFAVHVGVDTGKTFHKLVARRPGDVRSKPFKVTVDRAGFDAAHAHLRELYPDVTPDRTLVGIEFAGHHGFTFAHDLARRGYQIVTVLPSATKRLKDLGTNRTRKSDDIDAWQICKLVGQGVYVSYPLLDPVYTSLRLLTTARRRLSREEVRFKNRLQGLLDLAWPEFLRFFADLEQRTPVAILERWPMPQDFVAAPEPEVRQLIRAVSRNHVKPERIDALLASARATVALSTASEVRRIEIVELLERWALTRRQKETTDARIAAVVAECRPARALATVPEVGPICAATIVSELGTPEDFESPRQVLALAGLDLSGHQSGISVRSGLRASKRGRPMLRRELYLLAGRWVHPTRGLYRTQYEAMLARNGNKKTKAVCAIARKLVPMLLTVAQVGDAFDRNRWLADRRRPEPPPSPQTPADLPVPSERAEAA
jgi:transposase